MGKINLRMGGEEEGEITLGMGGGGGRGEESLNAPLMSTMTVTKMKQSFEGLETRTIYLNTTNCEFFLLFAVGRKVLTLFLYFYNLVVQVFFVFFFVFVFLIT